MASVSTAQPTAANQSFADLRRLQQSLSKAVLRFTGHALWRLQCLMQLNNILFTGWNLRVDNTCDKAVLVTVQNPSKKPFIHKSMHNQVRTTHDHVCVSGRMSVNASFTVLVHGQSPNCSLSPWVWRSVCDMRGENQYPTAAQCERNSVRRIIYTEGSLIINWHQFGNEKVSFGLVMKRHESTHDNVTHRLLQWSLQVLIFSFSC